MVVWGSRYIKPYGIGLMRTHPLPCANDWKNPSPSPNPFPFCSFAPYPKEDVAKYNNFAQQRTRWTPLGEAWSVETWG